jgi:hypothetical protein
MSIPPDVVSARRNFAGVAAAIGFQKIINRVGLTGPQRLPVFRRERTSSRPVGHVSKVPETKWCGPV